MRLLIAYGSLGKLFHLKELADELEKHDVQVKLIKDTDYSRGFPSRRISDWINGDQDAKKLIKEFSPDAIFTDRQSHFALHSIRSGIPTFILLRGHYWQEYFWGMKTLGKNPLVRITIWLRNRIAEKVFSEATAILPICKYLEDVVKKRYPDQNTGVFLEGINSSRWFHVEKMSLENPCVGLVQSANMWEKTKQLMLLPKILEAFPNIMFYWVGDGPYRKTVLPFLEKYENFKWLGKLEYPRKIRQFLSEIDIYALLTGIDMSPLSLQEAQLMGKPVIATNVGGIPELMKNEVTGFLVEKDESSQLIEKISLLLNDPIKRKEIGNNGRKFVNDNFTWDIISKKFIHIMNEYNNK